MLYHIMNQMEINHLYFTVFSGQPCLHVILRICVFLIRQSPGVEVTVKASRCPEDTFSGMWTLWGSLHCGAGKSVLPLRSR